MRVLILGAEGMLGHQLLSEFAPRHETFFTLRRPAESYRDHAMFSAPNAIFGVDAQDEVRLGEVIKATKPNGVINAIGIVKQRSDADDAIQSIEINALLPHRLARICGSVGAQLIHVSTDCVFTGSRGSYTEDDVTDALDLYGRTKLLGEVTGPGCVTLRTSIIGLELARRKSLVEWFLSQRGTIQGYRRAIYSGLTTMELARVMRRILEDFPDLQGLFHVVSAPISKYDMLRQLAEHLGRKDITIEPNDSFVCDRSMRGARFELSTGYKAPPWPQLLDELAGKIKERSAQ